MSWPPRQTSGFPGRDFFRGKSPRQILAWLFVGDPLEIGRRCGKRLHELRLFVDPERLLARALAKTARDAAAGGLDQEPALDERLGELVDEAIDELLREDEEAELLGSPPDGHQAGFYAPLAEIALADPEMARRLAIAFNRLPLELRQPFFAAVVCGVEIERYARETDTPAERVSAAIDHAIAEMVREARNLKPRSPKLSRGRGVP